MVTLWVVHMLRAVRHRWNWKRMLRIVVVTHIHQSEWTILAKSYTIGEIGMRLSVNRVYHYIFNGIDTFSRD